MTTANPFKFFNPYTKEDRESFFGRTEEIEELYKKLKQTNLLLLYGFIGTGKTSLVRCGLATKLRDEEWLPILIHRGDNILESLRKQLSLELGSKDSNIRDEIELVEEIYYEHLVPVYLIFDQFEELLILGQDEEKEAFFQLLNQLIQSRFELKVVLVFREEYKAYLDKYEKTVERLFSYRFRLEPMRSSKVKKTIHEICSKERIPLQTGLADRMTMLLTEGGGYKVVKLTYLQILLYQLFNKALEQGIVPVLFNEALLSSLGEFSNILSKLLHEQIDLLDREYGNRKSVWLFLKQFVTIEGTKKPIRRDLLFARLNKLRLTRDQLQQYLDFFVSSQILRLEEGDKYEMVHDTIAAEVSKVHVQTPLENPETLDNPYKGLQPFKETDGSLFFGRKKVLEDLYTAVQDNPIVILVGDTGCGKSSLVRAGLLPQLQEEGYHIFDIIRPGMYPLRELERKVMKPLKTMTPGMQGIVTIDQSEEIFTRVEKKGDRIDFIEKIKKLVTEHSLKLILTLRIDFEAKMARLGLKDEWKQARFPVPIPTVNEYIEIIEQPAFKAGCYFEPETLIDEIAQEATSVTIALPLLSFFLNRLYLECKDTKVFTTDAYHDLGGVVGALSYFADDLYQSLDQRLQNSMKKFMVRLVSLKGSELAARRVRENELKFNDPQEDRSIQEVMKILIEPGLIIEGVDPEGGTYVEPSHDALLWGWDRLQDWIDEIGKDKIILRDRLQIAVKEWSGNEFGKDYLWHEDPSLDQLKLANWLNQQEEQFVRESEIEKKKSKRKLRNINIALVCGVIACLLAALYTVNIRRRNIALEKEKIQTQQKEDRKRSEFYEGVANSNELTTLALIENSLDRTVAFNLAQLAINADSTNPIAKRVRNNIALGLPTHPIYQYSIEPSQGYVADLDISPDGESVVVGGADGSLSLFSKTGAEKWAISVDSNASSKLSLVQFSHTGKKILRTDGTGYAYLHQGSDGEQLRRFKHSYTIKAIDFSNSDTKILTAGNNGRIKIWRASQSRDEMWSTRAHKGDIVGARFLRNDDQILSGGFSDHITIKNYINSDTLFHYPLGSNFLSSLEKSSDDSIIVAGFENGLIKLWRRDQTSWKAKLTIKAHEARVEKIILTEDGKQLLSCSQDKTAKLWDLEGNLLKTFLGHHDALLTADIADNQAWIATGGEDQTLKLWNLMDFEHHRFRSGKGTISTIEFIYDIKKPREYKIAAGGSDGVVSIWKPQETSPESTIKYRNSVYEVKSSPDANYMVILGQSRTTQLHQLNGKGKFELRLHRAKSGNHVRGACFTPDGKYVFTSYAFGQIAAWDMNGKQVYELQAHQKLTTAEDLAVSTDGRWLLSAGHDLTVKLWEIKYVADSLTLDLKKILTDHTDKVECVAFSPDGHHYVTGSWDNTFKLYTLDKDSLLRNFIGHTSDIQALDFSPDGKTILSASSDNTVRLWGLDGSEKLSYLRHENSVWDAQFSPDGRFILTGSKDGSVRLWKTDMSEVVDKVPPLSAEQKSFYGIE